MVEVSPNTYVLYNLYTTGEVNLDQEEDLMATYFGELDLLDDEAISIPVNTGKKASGQRSGRSRQVIESSDDEEEEEEDEEEEAQENDDQNVESGKNLDIGNLGYTLDEVIEQAKRSLLIIVLSLIYMNEYPMPEIELLAEIKDIGLSEECKIVNEHGMFW